MMKKNSEFRSQKSGKERDIFYCILTSVFCMLLLLAGCGGSGSNPPANGALMVSAESDFGVTVADAAVFLNDVAKGTAPLEIKDLAPGTYTLKLTSGLYKDYTASVVIQSSVTTSVTATMEAKEAVPDASTVFSKSK